MTLTFIALYLTLCSLLTLISSLHRHEPTTHDAPRPIASHPFNK